MGDFNEILAHHEKEGIQPQNQQGMEAFRGFLDTTGLMDFCLKGNKFTWASNPRGGIIVREKLDRVLAHWSLRAVYSHAIGEVLPMISSDHAPIVFHFDPKGRSERLFRYEAFWEEHEDCKDVVKQGWVEGEGSSDTWKSLLNKTNSCRAHLQRWHRSTFKNAQEEISKLKKVIAAKLEYSCSNTDWAEIKEIQRQIEKLWKQEEVLWGQRSRLKWLQWGDRNSRFFHATTIQRRERNKVVKLKNSDGEWVEGLDNMLSSVQGHFQEVYRADVVDPGTDCFDVIPVLVSQGMNERLTAPVTDAEIWSAVESLGATKAPGPDGLNGMFYQKNWSAVGKEVWAAVQNFF